MGCCLSFVSLSHIRGIARTTHDRQPAQTGYDLTQDFKPFASKVIRLNLTVQSRCRAVGPDCRQGRCRPGPPPPRKRWE